MIDWRRLILGGALVVAGLLGWATPASAHAALVSSSPPPGAHLTHSPPFVAVMFDQPVKPDEGGIRILNSSGQAIAQGPSTHPSPNVLRTALPSALVSGAYAAKYTVTSVDSHVVSGGVVFLVGNVTAGQIAQVTVSHTSLANWTDDFGQFLIYLGVLVAAGLSFFLAFVLREGAEDERLRRWTLAAAALGVIGMLVTAAAQAALAGGGAGAVLHWSVLSQAVGGKFGAQSALQLAGLAMCTGSLFVQAAIWRQFAAFYGLLVSAGAFVLFGHAIVSPERWLSIPADVIHAVFAAMWAGGLMGLVVVLRGRVRAARRLGQMASRPGAAGQATDSGGISYPRPTGSARAVTSTAVLERAPRTQLIDRAGDGAPPATSRGDDGRLLLSTVALVDRFSTMAGISFALIILAGVLLAVAEVGSVANLFETGYGQLLLVKLALVGLLLVMAAYNRYLLLPVLRTRASAPGGTGIASGWQRLLSTVRWEAVGMVAVLAVTSVLANGTPSNGATPVAPVPFTQSQAFNGGRVTLHISPNQALVNDWTVQFATASGAPTDMAESVSVYLTLPAENVGPIEADMTRTGVGRFLLANSPNPPIVGVWNIVLQVQVSEFSQPDVSFVDRVQ